MFEDCTELAMGSRHVLHRDGQRCGRLEGQHVGYILSLADRRFRANINAQIPAPTRLSRLQCTSLLVVGLS